MTFDLAVTVQRGHPTLPLQCHTHGTSVAGSARMPVTSMTKYLFLQCLNLKLTTLTVTCAHLCMLMSLPGCLGLRQIR
jgi:hypothetical protein